MVKTLKRLVIYLYYKITLFNKRVVFQGIPSFDMKVTFEGYNKIHKGALVKKSFIGLGTYVGSNTKIINSSIGRYCTIAENVRLSLGRHPSDTFVSIHPAFFSINKQGGFTFVDRTRYKEHVTVDDTSFFVVVGNDVWIANNVLIMDGVTIGDGAIIAAGAVVTKDVAPYAIVGGVPAKLIKYRFAEDEIQKLCTIKWWANDISWMQSKADLFADIKLFLKNVT